MHDGGVDPVPGSHDWLGEQHAAGDINPEHQAFGDVQPPPPPGVAVGVGVAVAPLLQELVATLQLPEQQSPFDPQNSPGSAHPGDDVGVGAEVGVGVAPGGGVGVEVGQMLFPAQSVQLGEQTFGPPGGVLPQHLLVAPH